MSPGTQPAKPLIVDCAHVSVCVWYVYVCVVCIHVRCVYVCAVCVHVCT